jgi:two-component system LytT family response regulator
MAEPLKTIIVEDEIRGRNALKSLLTHFPDLVNLVGEAGNVDEAIEVIAKTDPDLVLLDIEMPYKNGFDLLNEVPKRNFDVIFTTAYNNYAIQAIKFSALDYLLKPIDMEELSASLHKAVLKRQNKDKQEGQIQIENLLNNLKAINNQNYKLSLPTSEGILFISLDQIIRCESDANYTRFFLVNEKPILVSRTLKEYEELLQNYNFCRVHHSNLINLRFIKKYVKGEGGIAVMLDGAEVEVSRRKKEAFLKSLENLSTII